MKFSGIFLLFWLALIPGATSAQNYDINEIAPFAEFNASIQEKYVSFTAMVIELGEIETLAEETINGAMTVSALKRIGLPALANARRSIDLLKPTLDQAVPDPAIKNTKPFITTVRELLVFSAVLSPRLEESYEITAEVLEAAINKDEAAYSRAAAKSLRFVAFLLESENMLLSSQLVQLKTSHPQHGLLRAWTGVNEFLVSVNLIAANATAGQLTNYVDFLSKLEIVLREIDDALADSKRAQASMIKSLSDMFSSATSTADARMFNIVLDLLRDFDEAIAAEVKITELLRNFHEILTEYNNGEIDDAQYDDSFTKFQILLPALIDERLRLHAERGRLAATISGVQ